MIVTAILIGATVAFVILCVGCYTFLLPQARKNARNARFNAEGAETNKRIAEELAKIRSERNGAARET